MNKRTMKWKVWQLALVVFLVLTSAACSSKANTAGNNKPGDQSAAAANAKTGDTIKIGVIVADTGPASSLGKPEAQIARLLKKQLEAENVGGKKVELVISDYETNDTNAVVIAKKMINEEKVSAIVGGTQTSTSVAIGEVAKNSKVPFLALAPLNKEVLVPYVFQIPQSNETVLNLIIDYLKTNNIKTVAWTNARDGFGQTGLPIFKQLAQKNGIDIVAVEDFDAAATDMTVQLTKIKPKKPGAVIVWSRPPGAGIIAKNFKQLGFDVPMIQSHAVSNAGFLQQVGAEGEGVLVAGSKLDILNSLEDSEQKKLFAKFMDSFKAEYNTVPSPFAGYAYDGIQMVLKAIAQGHQTPQAISDYIEGGLGTYLGVSGTFSFSKDNRDAVKGDGMALLKVGPKGWEPAGK